MPQNSPYTFEICAESPAAIAASAAFADRIELCGALDVGGVTPDIGMMEFAASLGVETHVLIRTRSGDFTMSSDDITVAIHSIRTARELGLKGIVIGAERNGALDRKAMDAMIRAADGLDVTLHRVVDVVDDPEAAVDIAVDLGATRILTSGGTRSAEQGIEGLNRLHAKAAGRIEIMAGSGVNSANLPLLMENTPITAFHASCSQQTPLGTRYAEVGLGQTKREFDPLEAEKIASILRAKLPEPAGQ
ncbi:copper homeostasis protein CutC [Octadecabacter ascidiaceicola]|nr:copper homeostasis protein CutC [Octadecabacter ascidiaceicola]